MDPGTNSDSLIRRSEVCHKAMSQKSTPYDWLMLRLGDYGPLLHLSAIRYYGPFCYLQDGKAETLLAGVSVDAILALLRYFRDECDISGRGSALRWVAPIATARIADPERVRMSTPSTLRPKPSGEESIAEFVLVAVVRDGGQARYLCKWSAGLLQCVQVSQAATAISESAGTFRTLSAGSSCISCCGRRSDSEKAAYTGVAICVTETNASTSLTSFTRRFGARGGVEIFDPRDLKRLLH